MWDNKTPGLWWNSDTMSSLLLPFFVSSLLFTHSFPLTHAFEYFNIVNTRRLVFEIPWQSHIYIFSIN